jgi:hypothetical protein
MKGKVFEMASWWNYTLMKQKEKVHELTPQLSKQLMKCQVDEMTSWWNNKLMKW